MDETEKKLIEKLIRNAKLFENETVLDIKEVNTLLNLIKRQEEKIEQLDLINSNYSAIASQQQKEIEDLKNRKMELVELLDKQEIELKSMKRELEIEIGCSISKDKEIEELKRHFEMATRIIEGYADEVEKDTLKIENYRHKNIK